LRERRVLVLAPGLDQSAAVSRVTFALEIVGVLAGMWFVATFLRQRFPSYAVAPTALIVVPSVCRFVGHSDSGGRDELVASG
jgi:hypothetical protein